MGYVYCDQCESFGKSGALCAVLEGGQMIFVCGEECKAAVERSNPDQAFIWSDASLLMERLIDLTRAEVAAMP